MRKCLHFSESFSEPSNGYSAKSKMFNSNEKKIFSLISFLCIPGIHCMYLFEFEGNKFLILKEFFKRSRMNFLFSLGQCCQTISLKFGCTRCGTQGKRSSISFSWLNYRKTCLSLHHAPTAKFLQNLPKLTYHMLSYNIAFPLQLFNIREYRFSIFFFAEEFNNEL